MKKEELHELAEGIKKVWATLSDGEQAELQQKALVAHRHLLALRAGPVAKSLEHPPRELLFLHSFLHDDPDGLLADAVSAERRSAAWVGSDGGVHWGGVDYDNTDPGWVRCVLAWYETRSLQPPFSTSPAVVEIPDTATLAILGDWGGNNPAAQEVSRTIQGLDADYLLHLGDVYYAGTDEHGLVERDYQRQNFLDVWPGVAGRSFALNSNHDMYAHGSGYFRTTLDSPIFAPQESCSYFALVNQRFRFVGLDTAFFDPDRSGHGFMTGRLDSSQEQFLHEQASAAAASRQGLVLLSHHCGLSIDGTHQLALWQQVSAQLAPLGGQTVVWYWGHEHAAAVYTTPPADTAGVRIAPRCCGHGCVPWGSGSDLARGAAQGAVSWYENTVLGPGSDYFVTNGFSTLVLDGASLVEKFYGKDTSGHWSVHWQGSPTAA